MSWESIFPLGTSRTGESTCYYKSSSKYGFVLWDRLVTLRQTMVVGTGLRSWLRRGLSFRWIHLFQEQRLQLKLQQLWLQHHWCSRKVTPHIQARCLSMLKNYLVLLINIEAPTARASLTFRTITIQQDMVMSSCGQLAGSTMLQGINHIFNMWLGKMENPLQTGEVQPGFAGTIN